MKIEDLIAAEAQASEDNKDAPIGTGTRITRGHQRTQTLQVRLNDSELDALTTLAQQRGIPPSTLARDILLGHMESTPRDPGQLLARIRTDLDALSNSVA